MRRYINPDCNRRKLFFRHYFSVPILFYFFIFLSTSDKNHKQEMSLRRLRQSDAQPKWRKRKGKIGLESCFFLNAERKLSLILFSKKKEKKHLPQRGRVWELSGRMRSYFVGVFVVVLAMVSNKINHHFLQILISNLNVDRFFVCHVTHVWKENIRSRVIAMIADGIVWDEVCSASIHAFLATLAI